VGQTFMNAVFGKKQDGVLFRRLLAVAEKELA
jgi:hypothetical protein